MSAFVGTVLVTASRDFFDRPNPADVAVGVAYTNVWGTKDFHTLVRKGGRRI